MAVAESLPREHAQSDSLAAMTAPPRSTCRPRDESAFVVGDRPPHEVVEPLGLLIYKDNSGPRVANLELVGSTIALGRESAGTWPGDLGCDLDRLPVPVSGAMAQAFEFRSRSLPAALLVVYRPRACTR